MLWMVGMGKMCAKDLKFELTSSLALVTTVTFFNGVFTVTTVSHFVDGCNATICDGFVDNISGFGSLLTILSLSD